ncbi:MAG: glycosyltransferase [Lachnospiraceae bacterium]
MIRVLHINAGSQNFGGVSAILLNLYRNIDRTRVQFDFLTPNISTYAMHREEIEGMGGHIYELGIDSSKLPGKMKLYAALRDFFRDHRYDIVHVNAGVLLFNCFAASAAHRFTRSQVFVHAHSNGGRSEAKEKFSEPLKKFLASRGDVLLACSESAAAYMFPEEALRRTFILKNGIDARHFAFSESERARVREELGLADAFVIGSVGRFSPEKNHAFMLDILQSARKRLSKTKLLLVGGGQLLEPVREKAKAMGLLEAVVFAGPQADVAPYYMAMDAYLQPSEFEGFGICCLEAEATGLPVVASDRVPEDADVAGNMRRLALEDGADAFAGALLSAGREAEGEFYPCGQLSAMPTPKTADVFSREDAWKKVLGEGYDIVTSTRQLEELYETAVPQKRFRKK